MWPFKETACPETSGTPTVPHRVPFVWILTLHREDGTEQTWEYIEPRAAEKKRDLFVEILGIAHAKAYVTIARVKKVYP